MNWKSLSEEDKRAQICYAVGNMYWEMYNDYAGSSWTRGLDESTQKQYLQPLLDKAVCYFKESLGLRSTFETQIAKVLGAKEFLDE